MPIALFSQRASAGITVAAVNQVISITGGSVGNFLIALITIDIGTPTFTSITDNGTGAWQSDQVVNSTASLRGYVYASKKITGTAPTQITITFSAATKFTWRILEYSGLHPTAWFDKAAAAKQTGGGTTTPVTNAAAPVAAGELAIVSYSMSAETSAGYTPPAGYASFIPLNQTPDGAAGDNENCAAGSQSASASWAASSAYAAGLAFYFPVPVPKAIPLPDKRRRLLAR